MTSSVQFPRNRQASSSNLNLSRYQSSPTWVLRLGSLKQGLSLGVFLLVAGMLGTYGWSVYSQRQWGQQYSSLKKMQREERQLITFNEELKSQMAADAQNSNTGLVPLNPSRMIFLQLQPPRSPKASASPKQVQPSLPKGVPLSY
jgi:hypothetical protein